MKKTLSLLLLLAAASLFAAPADDARAKADAARALATRQGELRNTFNAQMKDKAFTNALATAAELMALSKDAERPAASRGASAFFLGKALSTPLNLRVLDQAKEYLAIAAAEAPSAYDRAHARLLLLNLKTRTDPDAEYDADVTSLKAFIEDPGLPAVEHVRFLFGVVPQFNLPFAVDVISLAEKAAGTNDAARAAFYGNHRQGAIKFMANAVQHGSLDAALSREARLALIDRALADEGIANHSEYPRHKVDVLRELGRYDEAEKYILEGIAHTNSQVSASDWQELLGKCYADTARRYYAPADPTLTQKAIAAYRRALEIKPQSRVARLELPDLYLRLGDYDAARQAIEYNIGVERGNTNAASAVQLANIAFAQKNYAEAVDLYALVDKPDLGTREKLARALYALSRFDECLVHLDILAKETRNRYRRPYFQYCADRIRASIAK